MKKIIVLLLLVALICPVFASDKKKADETSSRIVTVFYAGLTIWGIATGISTGLVYCYFTGALFGTVTIKAITTTEEK